MIMKERTFPSDIKVLQALKRRLVEHHPQSEAVNDQLKLRLTGYKGELSLNYPLTFLPSDHYIFHDLRLYDGTHHFQIDCLVVTASLLIILEVKNIGGELFFNQRFHYLERKWEEDHSTFADPVIQVGRHTRQLRKLLKLWQIPNVPIYGLVVNSHPTARIDTDNDDLENVIRIETLPEKISTLMEGRTPILNASPMNRFTTHLLTNHESYFYDYVNFFKLEKEDFKKGVFCPECSSLPMKRMHGRWKCVNCAHISKSAHVAALEDYSLLIGKTITNKQARNFLRVPSPSAANILLKAMKIKTVGRNKGRIYVLE
ncbi:NERD domain-containing protein [Halobacillus kuroshimensis]|uniref:NERD domain-containing protein n=1 Tax=Halobacillus kuroshimensis TaxID=302481 RepID=A0ABS3DVA5_9BACI|nr:nuclease-related domain-containing protein [Halobacillus kuroshimensis]MBN8235276.1 NERD domain-containing protein [Halobacillus kuroshimensis]